MNHNQQSEDDLKRLDLEIKIYEDKIKSLEKEKNGMYSVIKDLQVTIEMFRTSKPMIERGYLPNVVSEMEAVKQIRKHKNSAAGILYELITRPGTEASHDLRNRGVVGIVATLGKVDDGNISRLLSEFLGTETMLAVVCDTLKSAEDIVSYDNKGSINKNMGIYKFGEAIGRTINGRFLVICLEKLRPYVGEFIADDPQRRLDLLKPRLPDGEFPRGFLGFAVNMISIDGKNLFFVTPKGHGLRETLFYHLFSRMQVYRSREDMLQALPFISDGAISLDGGIIRSAGMFILGYREEPDVVFPKCSGTSCPPEYYLLLEAQLREKELKQKALLDELQSKEAHLKRLKRRQFIQSLGKKGHMM